ncbi:MAG: tRNA (adenosine(37)-N6)-threonylcarbamoyltransferase complex dimerization subunit type 1 TsaB [Lachnospiraceae bacterium]|nr:tRNA (adenosine(37)-N6)-threonylcarbamoyltransferase complex dimerization subunit type 1 TsaB [Lachnospiraceae bacterium]
MKILAIEASGPVAGCAILEDDTLLGEYRIQNRLTHSQTLVPIMEELTERLSLDLAQIDAIALTQGPGSFTGLRIGAATAKGVGFALNKPIIGVPTTDAIAANAFGTDMLVCPLMDARRGQVYTGIYEERDRHAVLRPCCAVRAEEILEDLNERGREVLFLGDGVPVAAPLIQEKLKVPFVLAPPFMNRQSPAVTATLAMALYREKGDSVLVPADDFRPEYLRRSQAERQLEEAKKEHAMDALAAGRLVRDMEERKKTLPEGSV